LYFVITLIFSIIIFFDKKENIDFFFPVPVCFSFIRFRIIDALKLIIRRRQPRTDILDGEFIHGLDRKMRYFKPLRIEIYSFLREQIIKWAGDNFCLYLCMESNDVWREGLEWSPQNTAGLSSFLDNRVRKIFKS